MTHLRPCPECRRHVRAEESACVFCAAALPPAPPAPRLAAGRFTRAAVFAGASLIGAGGAAACGGGVAKTDTTPQTTQPFYTQTTGGGALSTPDAGPPPPALDAGPQVIEPDRIENMPYGAPPARDRAV